MERALVGFLLIIEVALLTHTTSNARTRAQFKPRSTTQGKSSYQLRQFAEQTLGSGSLRKATKLPEGEDLNEWLAVNGMRLVISIRPVQMLRPFQSSGRFL